MKSKHVSYCLLALCWMQTGFCQVTMTIPGSGDNIVGDVGDKKFVLFCELLQDGMEQSTVWSIMVEGQTGQSTINRGDPGFNITGDPIPDNPGFFFNTNLTILELTADLNNAIIYCGVPATLLVANFTIRLYIPPSLIDRGVVHLAEGDVDSVDLIDPNATEAFPLPAVDQITWRMGGSVVSSGMRVTYGYPSVMFNAVERGDAGDYTLSATNTRPNGSEIGSDTGSFTLDVYYGPSIDAGDDHVPVAEGGVATLLCGTTPDGNPAPFVDWTDNNEAVVPDSGRYSIVTDGSEVSLTIQGVTASDAGDWQCSLTVEVVDVDIRIIGDPVVRNITLFVVVPPSTPTAVKEQGIDGTTVLVCWQPSADIGTAGIERYRIFVDPADVAQPIETPNNLTFFNVTGLLPVTEYQFRIQAVSEYEGVIVMSGVSNPVHATTKTSVPAPVCDTAPVSANGVITVTWDYIHTGGLNLTEVIVQYGVYSLEEIGFQDIPDGKLADVDQTMLDVEGLLAGQAYVFQITTSNDIGLVAVQCPPVVHLVGVPQTPVVDSIEPTPAGGGEIFVIVVIPAVDGFEIPPGSVTFTVTATLQPGRNMITVTVTVNNYSYGDEVMVMVSGLVVGQNYVFVVSASNVFGESETSESIPMEIVDNPTATRPPQDDESITGGVVGGTVGGVLVLIVAVVVSIIIIMILKKQRTGQRHPTQQHPADLPQNVDLPLTANTAYNIVDFPGCKNDPPLSQDVAYHTTQRQDDDVVGEEAL